MRKIMVPKFEATDGKVFDTADACAAHEGLHKCPKCAGSGKRQEKYDAYPSNLPDSGFVEKIQIRHVECDLCKGIGYTKEKFEAVQSVTAYRKV